MTLVRQFRSRLYIQRFEMTGVFTSISSRLVAQDATIGSMYILAILMNAAYC